MSDNKKYTFNPRTLMYEVTKRSRMSRVFGPLLMLAVSLVMAVVYFWIYVFVLDLELPKTALLKKFSPIPKANACSPSWQRSCKRGTI